MRKKNAFTSASDSFKEGWNKIKTLFSIVLVLFFLASCGSSDKTTGEDLEQEISDVVDVSKEYTEEQWDKMNAEIDVEMQKVSKDYNKLNDEFKDKFKSKKAELDKKKEQLQEKIKVLNQATGKKKML